jgi:hypothetical protein
MISPCLSPVSPFNFIKEILRQTEGCAQARHDSVVRQWNDTNRNPPTFLFFSSPPFPFPLLFRPLPPPFLTTDRRPVVAECLDTSFPTGIVAPLSQTQQATNLKSQELQ